MSFRHTALFALVITLVAGTAAADALCPSGNLVQGANVRGRGADGNMRAVTDGLLAREGWPLEAPQAVRLQGADSSLQIDLGRPRNVAALLVQVDASHIWSVEGSTDGWNWRPLWRALPVAGDGLRSRRTQLARPGELRFLRVAAADGEGLAAISELRAYCRVAPDFDSEAPPFYAPAVSPWVTRETMPQIKAAVAAAGLLLFLWGLALRRAGRPDADMKLRFGVLAVAGVLSAAAWTNLGRFNFEDYLHLWDQLHYFLGSKYTQELGYEGLYPCVAIADDEDGFTARLGERKIRDLKTNTLGPVDSVLRDPQRWKSRFTPERWQAFKSDVAWFRSEMPPGHWAVLLRDHGYNASPMWEAVGMRVSGLTRATRGALVALSLLDWLALVAMWAAVMWAFGWQAMCVGLLWWGTNYVADFTWTGGSFLRQDWLALTIGGICLVRRGRPAAGGFALTWATLLRIVPGFIVATLVLKVVLEMIDRRSLALTAAHRRFALGCLAALVALVPLSFTVRGPAAWVEFARNGATHLATPSTNTIGLGVVVGWEPSTRLESLRNPALPDPDREWKAARQQTLEARRVVLWIALAAYLALLGAAVRGQEDWVALVLGIGLIAFASVHSCYYFSVLLGYGALATLRRESIGAALCALSLWTYLAWAAFPAGVQSDRRFMADSVGVLLFVTAVTLGVWLAKRRESRTT